MYLTRRYISYEAAAGITTLWGLIILSVRVRSSDDGYFIADLYYMYALVHLTGMSASASEIYVPIGNDRFSCIVTLAARIRTTQMRSIDSFLCVTHLISFGPFVRFPLLAKSGFSG